MDNLIDSLQKQFCPPLDTSLLAALLADLDSDNHNNDSARPSPTPFQIQHLCQQLEQLAVQAEQDQTNLDYEFNEMQRLADDSPELSSTTTTTAWTTSSLSSSMRSFDSPLGFLQAALPHIAIDRLEKALGEAGYDANGKEEGIDGMEIDMEKVVEGLLTMDYLSEMEERGLSEDDEKEVEVKNKTGIKAGKRNRQKTTIIDLRRSTLSTTQCRAATTDPWTALSSLSTHLSFLLPPHPATYFQSYFHSPHHATPYHALCAALAHISQSQSPATSNLNSKSDANPSPTTTLPGILDIIHSDPLYHSLPASHQSRLISDAQLALLATHGRASDALDLIWLMHDLNTGDLELGVNHRQHPAPVIRSSTQSSPSPSHQPPPPTQPPSPKPNIRPKPSFAWQHVPSRRSPPAPAEPHPLAASIPAYARPNNSSKRGEHAIIMGNYRAKMEKRDELLREASKAWKGGSRKTRGGEVAFNFAERAREVQDMARKEALDAARTMVLSKRIASPDSPIDLHGTTVSEAIVIVQEILHPPSSSSSSQPSTTHPLKIITGRGSHSKGRVGVLKPALKRMLIDEGWIVEVWEAGLVVKGRR